MRCGALNLNSDGKAVPIRDGHDFRPLAALGLAHGSASVLGGREAAVDERFLQIQMAFVVERLRENFEEAPKQAGPVLFPGALGGLSARERGQEGADEGPLVVGEVTGMRQRRKGHLARMRIVRRVPAILFATPAHPDYPSGHSCASGAAGFVLAHEFGEHTRLTMSSDVLLDVTRSFRSFDEALEEIKNARIFSGIHFRTATDVGQVLGRSVADFILENRFQRLN